MTNQTDLDAQIDELRKCVYTKTLCRQCRFLPNAGNPCKIAKKKTIIDNGYFCVIECESFESHHQTPAGTGEE